MTTDKAFIALRDRLAPNGQMHLLQYWDELDEHQRLKLKEQIELLDIPGLLSDFKVALHEYQFPQECLEIEPIPDSIRSSAKSHPNLNLCWRKGLDAIVRGEVAAMVLAGGQGSRLGVDYPKGLYDVGLPSGKTLFQIQAERILKLKELAKRQVSGDSCERVKLPWFIMTSEHTMQQTIGFFEKHSYFGLPKDEVIMFEQDEMPSFTKDGRIIMSDKFNLFKAPDGNGGLYSVLKKLGMLEIMRRMGVKYVHVYCVDNILVKITDPAFVGYCIENSADCAVKVVAKEDPGESVGVVCRSGGKYRIVEYSELPEKASKLTQEDGKLVFRDGNICNHFFTVDFLERVANKILSKEFKMTNHPALKKIPSINGLIEGLKLEKFVFDVIPLSTSFRVWEVERNEEFSPLKNGTKSGKDSTPHSCRKAILDNHAKWLPNFQIPVEVSPIISYGGEGLTDLDNFKKTTVRMDGHEYLIIDPK